MAQKESATKTTSTLAAREQSKEGKAALLRMNPGDKMTIQDCARKAGEELAQTKTVPA